VSDALFAGRNTIECIAIAKAVLDASVNAVEFWRKSLTVHLDNCQNVVQTWGGYGRLIIVRFTVVFAVGVAAATLPLLMSALLILLDRPKHCFMV
jgi:hypothetical protein